MIVDEEKIMHITPQTNLPAALQYWELYLIDQGRSKHTVKSFIGDINLLTKYLPPDTTIGNISNNDLNHFLEWLENGRGKGIPCSPKSLSRRVTSIKSFFKWLSKNGRINADPAEEIKQQMVISPLPVVLTSQEIKKVLDYAHKKMSGSHPDSRPYVLIKLLLETGIKKNECLNIKLNHFEIDEDIQFLFVRYPDQKDRNKERKVQISQEFVAAYHEYLKQYQPTENVFPWSQRRLEYILEDIGKEAGIEKHISFSMCRWNCALQDLSNGLNSDLIRQKLGISKIQWREIFMKLKELSKKYS